MNEFTRKLIEAGHATDNPAEFAEPVTTSGQYQATNGFWYNVAWNAGRISVSDVGYSAEFQEAKRNAETLHGPSLPENSTAIEAYIRQVLM